MTRDPSAPGSRPGPVGTNGESSKLLSLLALAAGAATMPQSTNADVIFTDLSANPVLVSTNANLSFIITNLPGTARLGFQTYRRATAISSTRAVSVFQKAGFVHVKFQSFPIAGRNDFVVPVGAGLNWSQVAGLQTTAGLVAKANAGGPFPASFDKQYLLFQFTDSTQIGSPLRYGWVNLSLAYPGNGKYPELTIFGIAWDDTGALLAAGVTGVPEPGPMALLVLGALTLGAKGLRSWRRHRLQAGQP